MYRTAVVGLGLIGSSAARHLAETGDGVVGIGPAEPASIADHTGVYASHYDEGRMTRIVDPSAEWAIAARRSIERYADLERRSGIRFFTPAGYLGIGQPGDDYNVRCATTGETAGARPERLTADQIRQRFPYLAIGDDDDGLSEVGTAGHISPRAMVAAQTELARTAGAAIVRATATAIRPTSTGVEIDTDRGDPVVADRVLVTTGGFTSACGLTEAELGLTVFGRTVVLAKIEGQLADELSGMPTLIHGSTGAYILPPIRYPDGNAYLKIGIGTEADVRLTDLADLTAWFKGRGSERNRREFTTFLTGLIPALRRSTSWHTATCVVTRTASGLPIIDHVGDSGRIAVAVGGNGKGAKGADEWGRIAARLVQGEPSDDQLRRRAFALRPPQEDEDAIAPPDVVAADVAPPDRMASSS
ncbi:MAG: FAD-dependent oxidoreductase [Actinomycetota bacterium]